MMYLFARTICIVPKMTLFGLLIAIHRNWTVRNISHGSDDHFCSSDGKTLPIDFIQHELVTTSEEVGNSSLIKLIFYHGCQGANDYNISPATNGNEKAIELRAINAHNPLSNINKMEKVSYHSNCMTISGNIKGRAMSDSGNFTNCICQSFESNLNRKIKADFNALITEIGSNLEHKSNQSEICNINGALRFNPIRFEKCKDAKKSEKQ
eukprot:840426_1